MKRLTSPPTPLLYREHGTLLSLDSGWEVGLWQAFMALERVRRRLGATCLEPLHLCGAAYEYPRSLKEAFCRMYPYAWGPT
jgi:hypothetical protein